MRNVLFFRKMKYKRISNWCLHLSQGATLLKVVTLRTAYAQVVVKDCVTGLPVKFCERSAGLIMPKD